MSDTRLISLRMPKELLAEIDLIAEVEKRSRAQVIILKLQGNATATGIERHHDQAAANLIKAVRNGKSGGNSGEAGNHSEVDERGVGGGVEESDAGVVLTGSVRAVAGGGGGAVAGAKKASGKGKSVAGWVAPQENAKTAGVRGGREGDVIAAWFPNSMCPHKYANSFVCKREKGGC